MSRKSDVSEFNSDFKIRQDDLNQNKHVTETPSHAVSRTVTPFRAGQYRERSSKTGEGDFTPHQWRTQEFCAGGGIQQIQLRTEDRENRDLEAVAP